jgi:prepilin-type N-terminal cleavage/methylation domain
MRLRAARRGFTLLEILVAVVIFAGAVAVLSRLVTLGLDNADYAKLQGEGLLLVENRFAEIDAAMDENNGNSGGDNFPGWTTEVSEETVSDFLYRISVTAKHTSGATVAMTRFYFDQSEAEQAASQQNSTSSSSSSSGASSTSGASSGGGS